MPRSNPFSRYGLIRCLLVGAVVGLAMTGIAGVLASRAINPDCGGDTTPIFGFLVPTIAALLGVLRSEMNANKLDKLQRDMTTNESAAQDEREERRG